MCSLSIQMKCNTFVNDSLHFTVWSTKATCIIYTQKYESPFVNVNYTIYNSTLLYVMHNKTGPKQEDKCRAESNNNSNDQRRKDNMTYILPGEGGCYTL